MPEEMRKMEQFETRFMAAAAQDTTDELSTTAGVLSEAFGMDAASIDLADLQEVGHWKAAVSPRLIDLCYSHKLALHEEDAPLGS